MPSFKEDDPDRDDRPGYDEGRDIYTEDFLILPVRFCSNCGTVLEEDISGEYCSSSCQGVEHE